MDKSKCILCESTSCSLQQDDNGFMFIKCLEGFTFYVSSDIYELPNELSKKISNLIYERLLNNLGTTESIEYYYYDKHETTIQNNPKLINVAPLLATYPVNVIELTDRSLINFSHKYPSFGNQIGLDSLDVNATFCFTESYKTEFLGIINFMIELGYLVQPRGDSDIFIITAFGWQRIDELKKKSMEVNQAFVAMSFSSETNSIRLAFKKAIDSCGYLPVFIDEKEHNNQIVPEIFYEISRSKFIVVDVTHSNYGAYYEAGYAQGLGKQVIVCCKKAVFDGSQEDVNKPHFDVSQKSMVLWENDDDLVARLIRRIQSTVIK